MATLATDLQRLFLPAFSAAALLIPVSYSEAAGFPEPPVTFYGQVNQTFDGYTIPVTSGTLTWTLLPENGAPVTSTAKLSSTNGQSFYRLEIPVEKLPTGFVLTPGTIATTAASYGRGGVLLNGSTPLSTMGEESSSFSYSEPQRGKRERVDLILVTEFLDSDGDGLPDWFEERYGLDKDDPSDAMNLDSQGRTYLADYQGHIDPQSGLSTEYANWCASYVISGSTANPNADPDSDGVCNALEFALGTVPTKADSASAAQRSATRIETFNGKRYLTMAVTKPGRSSVMYVVESSKDLATWAAVQGTDVQTVANTPASLTVRDAKSLEDGASGAGRFLRLRVILNP